jgi:hypothetical protein
MEQLGEQLVVQVNHLFAARRQDRAVHQAEQALMLAVLSAIQFPPHVEAANLAEPLPTADAEYLLRRRAVLQRLAEIAWQSLRGSLGAEQMTDDDRAAVQKYLANFGDLLGKPFL